MRLEWSCIFSSQRDGKSFNTLMGRLGRCEAPSLLLIRDSAEAGALMGGFAPAPWRKSGNFFGDYSTFIFGLEPMMLVSEEGLGYIPLSVQCPQPLPVSLDDFEQNFYQFHSLQKYPASGINQNFQWCGAGFKQLPNGIGFGGAEGSGNSGLIRNPDIHRSLKPALADLILKFCSSTPGHFALYVDNTLDSGMSRPIATFGNNPLASQQVFQVCLSVTFLRYWQFGTISPDNRGEPGT